MSDYGYIGQNICEQHWKQLCNADSKTEKGLLKKIGLVRDSGGLVIPIKGEDNDE